MLTLLGNRYRIVREIGSGAMGRVYQAVDTMTGTAVAAKVMIADGDESLETLLRFQQEGAVLARLRHANIVTVYGTFLEEGSCSIIMELLEGHSLADLLRRERLSLSRIKVIGSQAASALSFAHERGVIHRDVKPSNIMVVGADRVKVTDFGIARVGQGGTLRTKTGMSLGTPLYMSPEQIEGGTIDARSDIYSLGAVLFEMVAGRPPFEGRDPLSVAFKHVHSAPPRPRELNADVPPAWESLVLRMLEKNPAYRVQTAGEVAEALRALSPDAGPDKTLMIPSPPPRPVDPGGESTRILDGGRAASAFPAVQPAHPDSAAAAAAPPLAGAAPAGSVPRTAPARRRWLLPVVGVAVVLAAAAVLVIARGLGGQTATHATSPPRHATVFPRELGSFTGPQAVTGDRQGNLYVAAWGEDQIVKLSPMGQVVARWGSKGTGRGQFNGPSGVALDSHGNIFVADSENNRIQELSPSGAWRATWGGPQAGAARGQFRGVHGIAVDSAGNVFVTDYGNNRVVKLSPAGAVLDVWGGPQAGSGPGQFDQPVGVAVDARGFVYVADFNNRRVEKLSAGGQFVKQFTAFGSGTGQARPHGVAVDGRGHIYVADLANNQVEEIGSGGSPLHVIGRSGAGRGELEQPADVYVDARGHVYVADSGNNRIQEFAPAG